MNILVDIKGWKPYVAYGRVIRMMELVRYIKGLRPDICAKVDFCDTILEVYKEAICVEHML